MQNCREALATLWRPRTHGLMCRVQTQDIAQRWVRRFHSAHSINSPSHLWGSNQQRSRSDSKSALLHPDDRLLSERLHSIHLSACFQHVTLRQNKTVWDMWAAHRNAFSAFMSEFAKKTNVRHSIPVKVWEHFWTSSSNLLKSIKSIYSPPCHPRCPCLSFFSRKEMKVFDEKFPGFFSI